jgi:hypothetical protein
MARVFGNINVGIWLDQDFCNLSPGAQRTYFQLITQSDIAACGTLALTMRRWSMTVPEKYRPEFPEWMEELARERFIVIDADTEELLVRSFVKWDGGYKNGNRLMAIKGTAEAVRSPLLRSVLAFQLSKVGISEVPLNALPRDLERPSNAVETPKVVVTLGESVREPETLNQEPGTFELEPASKGRAPRPKQTRIPAVFTPTDEQRAWATAGGVGNVDSETAQWWDHHKAKDTLASDWNASWRTWMRNAVKFAGNARAAPGPPQNRATTKAQGWLSLPTPDEPPALEGATA